MLWDIIRDWFVQYIFGGVSSNGSYFYTSVGELFKSADQQYNDILSKDSFFVYLPTNLGSDVDDALYNYISLGDWLSTTATIIVLCLIVAFLIFTTIYVFKWFAGLFKWR